MGEGDAAGETATPEAKRTSGMESRERARRSFGERTERCVLMGVIELRFSSPRRSEAGSMS